MYRSQNILKLLEDNKGNSSENIKQLFPCIVFLRHLFIYFNYLLPAFEFEMSYD